MALENDDGQVTEEPTARKPEQAAENGQRLTSKEMMYSPLFQRALGFDYGSPLFGHALDLGKNVCNGRRSKL